MVCPGGVENSTRRKFVTNSTTKEKPMTRSDVQEVVLRNMLDTVEELEGVEIDPARSMKELGANSLDIVEVVSCSMRELRVKVPRSELRTLKNIDALVDMLYRAVQQKEAPVAVSA
jgi:polyketide biosynthesis acyl carrier protein